MGILNRPRYFVGIPRMRRLRAAAFCLPSMLARGASVGDRTLISECLT
jgi:hypothetical protein